MCHSAGLALYVPLVRLPLLIHMQATRHRCSSPPSLPPPPSLHLRRWWCPPTIPPLPASWPACCPPPSSCCAHSSFVRTRVMSRARRWAGGLWCAVGMAMHGGSWLACGHAMEGCFPPSTWGLLSPCKAPNLLTHCDDPTLAPLLTTPPSPPTCAGGAPAVRPGHGAAAPHQRPPAQGQGAGAGAGALPRPGGAAAPVLPPHQPAAAG